MDISIINENDVCTIKVGGWLSTQNATEFGDAVKTIGDYKELILDFDAVEYMASSGLRQVVSLFKSAVDKGASFKVINVCVNVMEVFKLTGVDKKITLEEK